MDNRLNLKILIVLNPVSGGKKRINWEPEIRKYFLSRNDTVEFFMLTGKDDTDSLQYWFSKFKPDRVIAVGGDGTISMVAKQIMGTNIILGILPAGSANGMAKELQIPDDPLEAIRLITDGEVKCCDIIKVNDENICFHLSDLGLNARLIKYFDDSSFRGMWGYARMVFKVLWRKKLMDAHILADGLDIQTKAYMVVIANASKYGTGAVINPDGKVDDAKFEIIVLRKISIIQFVKMFWSYKTFNPQNVEIFHTTQATITTRHDTHFQIDGEFKGKINKVTAK
ncbi:MAG: diacylglycerol kinase family protein, partial [Ginsengibacter sp.]